MIQLLYHQGDKSYCFRDLLLLGVRVGKSGQSDPDDTAAVSLGSELEKFANRKKTSKNSVIPILTLFKLRINEFFARFFDLQIFPTLTLMMQLLYHQGQIGQIFQL
jgi:hypothetical protein